MTKPVKARDEASPRKAPRGRTSVFKPGVKLDTSQVKDLRGWVPLGRPNAWPGSVGMLRRKPEPTKAAGRATKNKPTPKPTGRKPVGRSAR